MTLATRLGLVGALTTIHLVSVLAFAEPNQPAAPVFPGSSYYPYSSSSETLTCGNRAVAVVKPVGTFVDKSLPLVVYGHGQALKLADYKATFEHLAKKGIVVAFPTYDDGFFDQNWIRMADDFNSLTSCALSKIAAADPTKVVYSGHSKGAYVASIAAGRAGLTAARPRSVLLFDTAGFDSASTNVDPKIPWTIVFGENDRTVKRDFTTELYSKLPSVHKQIIDVVKYPDGFDADHFWPLTTESFFGGHKPNALHYYGAWKWLTAAALDLKSGANVNNPFLYGTETSDKGDRSVEDRVTRNW